MARFQYRMQSILDIKLKMETQAKQEFASARAVLDEEEEKLLNLIKRKEEYEEEASVLLKDKLKIEDIRDNKNAIMHMEDSIKAQNLQVNLAKEQVEVAREKLKEIRTERKTQESLKEKDFSEFLQEENRKESKSIDQLTSYTYGQKQKKSFENER